MRLLLRLKSTKNSNYDVLYNHKIQEFIYNLMIGTDYESLHDKKTFKYFCFSNIFPIGDIKEGDTRNLIISSPDKVFIKIIKEKIDDYTQNKKSINFGEMEFLIDETKTLKLKLQEKNLKLISATPILLRIPEKNYSKFNIPEEDRKPIYVFWRSKYSIESFISHLEDNLKKKYNLFYNKKNGFDNIFDEARFKKMVYNKIILKGFERVYVGSIWEFSFNYLNPKKKKLLSFAIEAGFGERSSFGFGFMNPVINIG
ncbi:MAG: CRISPR-associated endoribonuclease Cas6 [Candidatus Aenigmarchaeota archaeon]|nr:CRISPR-associated endoribonuclease Cas6 [Candidatus Aenigmarchaeota archaeon]